MQGAHEEHPAKFQGFMMVAEPSPGNMAIQSPTSLGTFQLLPGDAMTKFSHKCSHSVEATSSMNKEHITVSRNLLFCWIYFHTAKLYTKVCVFWKGHKILRNHHFTFVYSTYRQK